MAKIGVFLGSFNPIHCGHVTIARHILKEGYVDQVIWVVSPQNPQKKQSELLSVELRLTLVGLAIQNDPLMSLSDIETQYSRPSYSVDTLFSLNKVYEKDALFLVLGYDNYLSFGSWRNYEKILSRCSLLVYPRRGEAMQKTNPKKLDWFRKSFLLDAAPMLDISASDIRSRLQKGKSIQGLVPKEVDALLQKEQAIKTCE